MEVTLALAILLGVGFAAAKIGQLIRLPSVTGYVCAGLILGPSGLGLITPELTGDKLSHFSQIALMLIAFGIGEHLELKRLKKTARTLFFIGFAEAFFAFVFVSGTIFLVSFFLRLGPENWLLHHYLSLAMLLGAVAIATAPASTLSVMREMRAKGPWTTTLMQVIAVDNGLAIMSFGITASVVRHFGEAGAGAILGGCLISVLEIAGSLLLGVVTGLAIDYLGSKITRRSEMLTAGLALLLLCGETSSLLDFSPLLAGMAAGFTIVNRHHRDVRFFRALNGFEAPIYVLFFTLAGVHFNLKEFALAGGLGLIYFLCRASGKNFGARLGAQLSRALPSVRLYLGQALIPQADVAIALIFLTQGIPELKMYTPYLTPVLLAGVFFAELSGPILARHAVIRAGEANSDEPAAALPLDEARQPMTDGLIPEAVQLIPWTWEKLIPPPHQEGQVLFGASHMATVAGLARMSTIIAHYHGAHPCAVRVIPPQTGRYYATLQAETEFLFAVEAAEVKNIGYELNTAIVRNANVANGILAQAESAKTFAIVIGHPLQGTHKEFERVVEQVVSRATCPVIIVRFSGVLHTEQILVPVTGSEDLIALKNIICALAKVGEHRITILWLLPPDENEAECVAARQKMESWNQAVGLGCCVRSEVFATEARLETIVTAAADHDLVVMSSTFTQGLERIVFGSLAENVAQSCGKPMLIVYSPNLQRG
ncbi:MAG: cation:proton antiporter [Desulfobulbaceae bacterium]|nr:cation:proton antiporter [Desulfobulbaceae bacterium]HIJ89348.1 universal stress protein [Deltaproteobacteria bacterium]